MEEKTLKKWTESLDNLLDGSEPDKDDLFNFLAEFKRAVERSLLSRLKSGVSARQKKKK